MRQAYWQLPAPAFQQQLPVHARQEVMQPHHSGGPVQLPSLAPSYPHGSQQVQAGPGAHAPGQRQSYLQGAKTHGPSRTLSGMQNSARTSSFSGDAWR
jgi:hypothetical protein